jgi:hypothetical protein
VPLGFWGILEANEQGAAFYRDGDGRGSGDIAKSFTLAETENFVREWVLEVFRGNSDGYSKWHQGNLSTNGAINGTIIFVCREKRMDEFAIEGFEIRKCIGVTKHDAEIGDSMIGAPAGQAENANGSVPSFGQILQSFFEIVMVLLGNFNYLAHRILFQLEMAEGFGCDGIEIADDGINRQAKRSGMFCATVGAEEELSATGIFERGGFIEERSSEQEEREFFLSHEKTTFPAPKISENKKAGMRSRLLQIHRKVRIITGRSSHA